MALALIDSFSSPQYELPNHTGSPERLLILAVLERAILDFVGNDRREASEAEAWIFNDEDMDELEPNPFSFAWVCKELDLNPTGVAEMIRAMPKRGSNRIAPWYFAKKSTSSIHSCS